MIFYKSFFTPKILQVFPNILNICIIYRRQQQAEIRQSDVVEVGEEQGKGPCPEEGYDQ